MLDKVDKNQTTKWKQWVTVKEERQIGPNTKQVTLNVRKEIEGTIFDLMEACSSMIKRYRRHVFNIRHQFGFIRELQHTTQAHECIIHIDYAENYVAKLRREIQSAHFGASKSQITLHTGVYYKGPHCIPQTFCSLSDSLEHGPSGIWAHLGPVLDDIQANHPEVDTFLK
jgi:hypothetical protein